MPLALRISSYGCTWEVWRATEKGRIALDLTNFPSSSITRCSDAWLAAWKAPNFHFLAFRARCLPASLTLSRLPRRLVLTTFVTERRDINLSTRFLDNDLETSPGKKSALEAKCYL